MLLVDDGVSHTRIIGDSGLVISDSGSVLGVTIPEVILSVSDMMEVMMVTTGGCHYISSLLCHYSQSLDGIFRITGKRDLSLPRGFRDEESLTGIALLLSLYREHVQ